MNELKKLRDEMSLFSDTQSRRWADTLDAYIKKQESAEPVAWVEVVDSNVGPYNFHGIKLLPEGNHHLYAAPPPREPITRDALSDLIRSVRYCETTLDEFASKLGIEVKP